MSSSEYFSPQSDSEIQKQKKNDVKKPKLEKSQFNDGLWNQREKMRYAAFMFYNKQALGSRLLRRTNKVFNQMSKFIISRSPSQCRSQNQKLFKRHKTIAKIINSFKQEFGDEEFDAQFENLCNQRFIKFIYEKEKMLKEKQTQDNSCQTNTYTLSFNEDEKWKFDYLNSILLNLGNEPMQFQYFTFPYGNYNQ